MTTTHDPITDLAAIDEIRTAHIAAINSGDADALAACFAEDGIQLPPHFPASMGREAIRGWARGLLAPFEARFSLNVDEVQLAGAWAFERGTYEFALTPRGGGPELQDHGKYITIYQRRPDGAWAIARDIWNTSTPPQMG